MKRVLSLIVAVMMAVTAMAAYGKKKWSSFQPNTALTMKN